MPLRREFLEQHLSYMDGFEAEMIARGPTFTPDGTMTGSMHMVDLPDPAAARAFAFDEPAYQAGVYRDVLIRRWRNVLGRTMWDFEGSRAGTNRYLVLGFTHQPAALEVETPVPPEDLIAFGPMLSDDGEWTVGVAAMVEAADAVQARGLLAPDSFDGIEVHQWRFGGRGT